MTRREFCGPLDMPMMLDLLFRSRTAERAADYPNESDLHELLSQPAIQGNTRLWLDEGERVVAFALLDAYDNLLFEHEPEASGQELTAEIVQWGVDCLRRHYHSIGAAARLDASCREDDGQRIAMLVRHGFVQQPERSLCLRRLLDEPIPLPDLPAGFTIRPLNGKREMEAWVLLHRAAFGTQHMTVEEKRAMMSAPDYDPQLDLVIEAPDGGLAAYCACQIHHQDNRRSGRNEGWTDPLATHPDYQRRGLARALLLAGMRLLKERGVESAVLGTSSENVCMLKAAQAVGFRLESARLWFARPVEC